MPLGIILNGNPRELVSLDDDASLDQVIAELSLTPGRIAVECNGQIAPRTTWPSVRVHQGDRLEIVHFVGGGRR